MPTLDRRTAALIWSTCKGVVLPAKGLRNGEAMVTVNNVLAQIARVTAAAAIGFDIG